MTIGPQNPSGRSPTLEDVAAAAGVSRSTASRAINGGSRVSPDAQAAVDAAVRELHFTPNPAARALVTQRANSVALLIPEPDERVSGDPFFAQVVQGLGQALATTDFQLILVMVRQSDDSERVIRHLRQGHVDGSVVVSHHQSDDIERALISTGLPSVFVGRPWYLPEKFGYVDTDNRLGAQLATEHLVNRGCRRIGTIAGPADMIAAVDRLAGWTTALDAAGLPTDAVEHGDFTTPGGTAATERLLARVPELDALFVANDLMAVGALQALKNAGRSVPAEVALVGYDNSAVASVTDPPLTTVVNPVTQMASSAGALLLERIATGGTIEPPIIFAPELIVRSSG
ncbi:MAG: LacI family DNA-binding transcriptional regulator [Nakamurella sp.]